MGYFEGEPDLTSNEIPITTTLDVLPRKSHKIAIQFSISWINAFKHREKLNSFPYVFDALMIGKSYNTLSEDSCFSISFGFLVTPDKALEFIQLITSIGGLISSVEKSYIDYDEDFERTKKEILMILEHCKFLLS